MAGKVKSCVFEEIIEFKIFAQKPTLSLFHMSSRPF